MGHESSPDPGQYSGVLAVDVRGFSKHHDAAQGTIVRTLPEVLNQAAVRANITDFLQENRFRAFRGDGYLIGIEPSSVRAVVDRYFDSLQAELRRRRTELQAVGVQMRMRASLHLGPLQAFDEHLADSPAGTVPVEAMRMIDAPQLRALLDRSDPEVTMVAVAVSDDVMKHVIRGGRTVRRATEFVAAPLRIAEKDFSGTGHLRVPTLSGDLLSSGLLGEADEPDPAEEPGPAETAQHSPTAPVTNFVGGPVTNANQARDIEGGVHMPSVHAETGGTAAMGNIDQSTNKQENSGQFTTQGDANFGSSSGRRSNRPHHDTTGK
ncbi:hypothetical protein IQ251_13015 [Saccharopolyspora sp. HNM0983]|uniref:Guanylate cyclase domain-containing protein n=1 Tax=Saccharopolyspora montiporae TaxID=2781240 RepID=A0A929G113_9PSEU|nr:hypothetical protein [Saccharopolyspora sp. HNM0983]